MKPHLDLSKRVNNGNCPCLVGEFGIAMDMKKKKAYEKSKRKGYSAFKWHDTILDLMYNAMDSLFLSSALWNYMPSNNNQFGDLWNLEDLSIFSRDQIINLEIEDLYSGGRGIGGFCRPFATKIAGNPLIIRFKRKSKEFYLEFEPSEAIKEPTEIFVPKFYYPNDFGVECSDAEVKKDPTEQKIYIHSLSEKIVKVRITPF